MGTIAETGHQQNVLTALYDSQQLSGDSAIAVLLQQYRKDLTPNPAPPNPAPERNQERILRLGLDLLMAGQELVRRVDDGAVLTQIWEELRLLYDGSPSKRAEHEARAEELQAAINEDRKYVDRVHETMARGEAYDNEDYNARLKRIQDNAALLQEHNAQSFVPEKLEELATEVHEALNDGKNISIRYKGTGVYEIEGKTEISFNESYDPSELRETLAKIHPFFNGTGSIRKLVAGKILKTDKAKNITGESVMGYLFKLQVYTHLADRIEHIAKKSGVYGKTITGYARKGLLPIENIGGDATQAVYVYRTSQETEIIRLARETKGTKGTGKGKRKKDDDLEERVGNGRGKERGKARAKAPDNDAPSDDNRAPIIGNVARMLELVPQYQHHRLGPTAQRVYDAFRADPTLSYEQAAKKIGSTANSVQVCVSHIKRTLENKDNGSNSGYSSNAGKTGARKKATTRRKEPKRGEDLGRPVPHLSEPEPQGSDDLEDILDDKEPNDDAVMAAVEGEEPEDDDYDGSGGNGGDSGTDSRMDRLATLKRLAAGRKQTTTRSGTSRNLQQFDTTQTYKRGNVALFKQSDGTEPLKGKVMKVEGNVIHVELENGVTKKYAHARV